MKKKQMEMEMKQKQIEMEEAAVLAAIERASSGSTRVWACVQFDKSQALCAFNLIWHPGI